MSKLEKPEHIIFIGANLYTDYIQYSYLQRVFPYIKNATHIHRYQTFSKDILKDIIKDIENIQKNATIFIIDYYYEKFLSLIESYGYKIKEKKGGLLFNIGKAQIIAKKISLFKQLPDSTTMVNNSLAYFKVFGNNESLEKMREELGTHASLTKILPNCYNVIVKDADGEKRLTKLANTLNLKILAVRSLKRALIDYLAQKEKTLTIAESCTGGLLAAKITSVSGASQVLNGSMVTYSNEIKRDWLGVKEKTLQNFGAVSSECVSEMLDGIKKAANASIAVAISGIAGPTGGTKEKPVGTVYIGVLNKKEKTIQKFQFEGDRTFIQELAARTALEMIIDSEKDFFDFF
jgi:nicotinamide-nucleotide amidase